MKIWSKILTRSDAQQKTRGSKMPFLRLTKGKVIKDDNWFKDYFFEPLNWVDRGSISEATSKFDIYILGTFIATRELKLNHKTVRSMNHSAPRTHLLYDDFVRNHLEQVNLVGKVVRIIQKPEKNYELHFG